MGHPPGNSDGCQPEIADGQDNYPLLSVAVEESVQQRALKQSEYAA